MTHIILKMTLTTEQTNNETYELCVGFNKFTQSQNHANNQIKKLLKNFKSDKWFVSEELPNVSKNTLSALVQKRILNTKSIDNVVYYQLYSQPSETISTTLCLKSDTQKVLEAIHAIKNDNNRVKLNEYKGGILLKEIAVKLNLIDTSSLQSSRRTILQSTKRIKKILNILNIETHRVSQGNIVFINQI